MGQVLRLEGREFGWGDVLAAYLTEFEDPEAAREILDTAGEGGRPLHPRLALACVELSGGDLAELLRWCAWARIDYRDVYMAAWYR